MKNRDNPELPILLVKLRPCTSSFSAVSESSEASPRPQGANPLCKNISTAISGFRDAILHVQQWLGAPLYFLNGRWYHAWQAVVKQSTALLILGFNQVCAPTTVRIGGDASVAGQIRGGKRLQLDFPDRMVLIANHQIYTDWIFFWWIAYTAGKHGHFFVVLKDALQRIPLLGWGMKFFSWIFLSRNWEADRVIFEGGIERLADIRTRDSMWLLLFPEGTNMSRNARAASQRWSSKSGTADLKHVLLPRSRGLQCCLQGLSSTVDWVYDCTIAYDGIRVREYGQEVHSMKKLFIEGRKSPRVHMHWRRFVMKDIPYDDPKALETWILERWIEKNELLEHFQQNGIFPTHEGYTVSKVEIQNWLETVQVFGGVAAVVAVWWIGKQLYGHVDSIVRVPR
ncbi:hypothetical protein M409DRAFT_70776 [Zasmidium cellare ATCC 36951]|uniref:Phospholipid/glycerol acyltransferase domain-containing protein n=1 Tax=Zasmidium cellare ATCC 36951 TaxID=1080233 RepID=A0A6A6BZ63_ZASCE|nr:uncharacterized protein M409DRAFT_70776 [Zasmidium cellare ATCC 36951]KAF2159893.1 hypothetical protein M409DRAFT_70776 [Zasmidium cellare ATCC 36951]